jgi:[acyl-carrier-protein] S-malonyltransferase
MLAKLAETSPVVRGTFDEASKALGYDLWQLVSQGPEEELNATERTQPAMLAGGIATWRLWQERQGAVPGVVTGHSLGEFTALVAAGALDFTTCIELVRFRGQAMQEAVPKGTGSMAALLGLEDPDVESACAEAAAAAGSVVEAVNFNAPGQVVIAGDKAAVLRAIEVAKARGAKKAIELPVSVPSHSSLMRAAGLRLSERLAATEIRAPRIRYVSAVDAREHSAPDDIRALLVRQLSSPVRWTSTIAALTAAGISRVVECGPGGVLSGLVKRIERGRETQTFAIGEPESFNTALTAVAA